MHQSSALVPAAPAHEQSVPFLPELFVTSRDQEHAGEALPGKADAVGSWWLSLCSQPGSI